jgi:cob(I)alamin adenosyltransferase
MKKSKIYTRTGDAGDTGLVSGTRVSKSDPRIDLYGELDELNSRIGLACTHLDRDLGFQRTSEFMHHVQSAIFDLGSNLACEPAERDKYRLPQLDGVLIGDLEQEIDQLEHDLPELRNFILPGGSEASALLHLCRTCARSVERKLISFQAATGEELPVNAVVFLNRLSDYLFVLARSVNLKQGGQERHWKGRKSN